MSALWGLFRALLPVTGASPQKISKNIHAGTAISWGILEEIVQPGQKEPHDRRRITCSHCRQQGHRRQLCLNTLCKYVMSLAISQSLSSQAEEGSNWGSCCVWETIARYFQIRFLTVQYKARSSTFSNSWKRHRNDGYSENGKNIVHRLNLFSHLRSGSFFFNPTIRPFLFIVPSMRLRTRNDGNRVFFFLFRTALGKTVLHIEQRAAGNCLRYLQQRGYLMTVRTSLRN